MGLADRIKEARTDLGMSQDALAQRFRVTRQAVGQWEAEDGTRPEIEKLPKLAKVFGVNLEWLIANEGPKHGRKANGLADIREVDARVVGGGGGFHAPATDTEPTVHVWTVPSEILRAHVSTPADRLRIIRIHGDSMAPDFRPGERVLVDTDDVRPSPGGVFVLHDGVGLVIKQLEVLLNSDPVMVRLKSRNPAYETYTLPLDDLRINGRVVARWDWT